MNEQIEVGGLKANYRVVGKGEPVLVLHGWGSSSNPWAGVQDKISICGFKVVVPDLIGFGQSDLPPTGWNMDDYADWLEGFVAQLSEKHTEFKHPFFLVGHSFGGRISIKIAARGSLPLSALVLCGAAGLKSDTGLKLRLISNLAKKTARTMDRLNLGALKNSARNFYYHLLRQDDYLKVPRTMKDTFRKVIREDLSVHLPEIKAPTLIVWGAEDRIVPVKQAYRFHQGIARSRLKVLSGVGHSPQLDAPEELSRELVKFFRDYNR